MIQFPPRPIFSLKCTYGVIFLLLTDVQRIICRAHCRMKEAFACGSVCWGWIWISQQFRELIVVWWLLTGCVRVCLCMRECVHGVPGFHLYGTECVFVCPTVTLRSIWKTQGWMGPLQVFEISCPASMEILHARMHTHTLKQTLTLRHVARTSTKGARGEKLIHTHTDEVKTAIYTWWVFDHQLSSISRCLSLCLSSSPSSSSGCSEVFSRASIGPDI